MTVVHLVESWAIFFRTHPVHATQVCSANPDKGAVFLGSPGTTTQPTEANVAKRAKGLSIVLYLHVVGITATKGLSGVTAEKKSHKKVESPKRRSPHEIEESLEPPVMLFPPGGEKRVGSP